MGVTASGDAVAATVAVGVIAVAEAAMVVGIDVVETGGAVVTRGLGTAVTDGGSAVAAWTGVTATAVGG